MDTGVDAPPQDNVDTKTAFRKPSNEAANRKYRRRALVNDGSSSSDGSPERNPSQRVRGDVRKVSEPHDARKDDKRESDRDSGRSRCGGSSDSHRHDRYSRDTRHYSKRDDYSRHERDGDGNGKRHRMSPPRSRRDSRSAHHSDHRRVETGHSRSRNELDRHSRDKYNSSGHRSRDRERVEEPSSDRAGSGRRHADSRSEEKEKDYAQNTDSLDERRDSRWGSGDHRSRDEKREYADCEINGEKDVYFKCPGDRSEDKSGSANENQCTPSKRMKGLSSEKFSDGKNNAEEKQSSSLKTTVDGVDKALPAQLQSTEPRISGDLDAAKVAAMKAAELVNRNLVGTGYLTTDQKKKLLWGNKKTTAVDETAHRWDTSLIGDRERQEKFNKLMGVRGNVNSEQNANNQEVQAEKQKELQLDLEKQYTAGLRRRDGRTVGLGL